MRYLGILSFTILLLFGPFALGILYSAHQLDVERKNLEVPYKVFKGIATFGLLLLALVLIYYTIHNIPSEE